MKIFDDIIRKTAEAVVEKAIKEFKAENLLRIPTMAEEGDLMLREYYTNGKWENEIKTLEKHPYFEIIELYYRDGMSQEAIAYELNASPATISRQRKHLCEEMGQMKHTARL